MLTTWPSKIVPFCNVQSSVSLNFVSQRQTCDDGFSQFLCFKVLGITNLRIIIQEEEGTSTEVGILLFYRNNKECQCWSGSLKCWEITYAKMGLDFFPCIKEFKIWAISFHKGS